MKILKLRFKNINSLRGEFVIDFTKTPLADSGIFAITGPTGAGKTTILDAICLALYHRTSRLSNTGDLAEIITRQTNGCFAEVEFEIVDKQYRAYANYRIVEKGAKKGKADPKKFELHDLAENKLLADSKSSVLFQITQLTSLSFEQFTRSLLLAQGSFAAFLNANDKDRADLLEKMTSSEIYARVSARIYQKTQDKKKAWDDKKTATEQIGILSEEEENKLLNKLKELKQVQVKLEAKGKLLQNKLELHKNFNTVKQDLVTVKIEQEKLSESLKKEDVKLKKLADYEKIRHLESDHKILQNKEADYQKLTSEQKSLEQKLPLLLKEHNNLITAGKASKKKLKDFQQDFAVLKPKISLAQEKTTEYKEGSKQLNLLAAEDEKLAKKISEKKEQLKAKQTEILQLKKKLEKSEKYLEERESDTELPLDQGRIKLQYQEYHELIKKVNSFRSDLQKRQKKITEFTTVYQKNRTKRQQELATLKDIDEKMIYFKQKINKILNGRDLSELENSYERNQELFFKSEQVNQLQKEHQKLNIEQKELETKKKKVRKKLDKNIKILEIQEKEVVKREKQVELLEENIQLYQKIKSLEDLRNELIDDVECPLCGAKEHPFALTNALPDNRQAELKEQKKILRQQVRDLEAVKGEKTTLIKELESINVLLDKHQEQLKELVLKWNDSDLVQKNNLKIQDEEQLNKIIEKLENDLESKKNALDELKKLNLKLQLLEQKKHSIEAVLNKIKLDLATVNSKLETLKNEFEEKSKEEELLIAKKENLYVNLNEILEKYELNITQEKLLEEVERRVKWLQNVIKLIAESNNKLNPLKQTEAVLQKEVTSIEEQRTGLKEKLLSLKNLMAKILQEKEELVGKADPLELLKQKEEAEGRLRKQYEEKQKAYQILDNELKVTQNEFSKLEKRCKEEELNIKKIKETLLYDLSVLKIDSLAGLSELLLNETEFKSLQRLKNELDEQKTILQTRFTDLNKKLESYQKNPWLQEDKEELLKAQEITTEVIKEQLVEQGGLEKDFSENEKKKKEQQEQLKLIKQLEKEYYKWNELNELIGSASGDKFRKFAQGLTLDQLLYFANKHLEKLSDRYLLERSRETDLGINVIDGYQADVSRPVKNLSGGESFVISLALALGLSDLNSDKAQISSLFLDEGFGTLDNESLDGALSVLENLHQSGKTIGVISHVKSLQERIPVQIRVKKIGNGVSTLEVVER